MPRKGHTLHRDVLADPVYNSKLVTKLVNSIMLDGKKGIAQKIVYGAFDFASFFSFARSSPLPRIVMYFGS